MTNSAPNIPAMPPATLTSWSLATVLRLYAAAGFGFETDLAQYAGGHGGYALSRPDLLIFFRPAIRAHLEAGEDRWLANPGEADAWYIRLLAGRGTLRAAVHEMPYYLPWCCWHRNLRQPGGPVHVACTETIIKKLRK